MDQAITAEFSALTTGRSVASGESVLLKIWYAGTGANPSVGVSNSTINLYDDGATDDSVDTSAGLYNTVGEVVDYIEASGDWRAQLGPDAYRDLQISTIGSGLMASSGAAKGGNVYTSTSEADSVNIYLNNHTLAKMTCGVKADSGASIRLKSIDAQYALSNLSSPGYSGGLGATISVFDGNTEIYKKFIGRADFNTTNGNNSSVNTIVFAGDGLSTTKNKSLCVVVSASVVAGDTYCKALCSDSTSQLTNQIAITYDKLRI